MDRRTMLAKTSGSAALAADPAFAKYANTALPKRAAVTSGLDAYAGTWDARHATHLLRRTLFGFSKADLDKALALTASTCVDALLNVVDETLSPPVTVDSGDTVTVGQTWVTAAFDGTLTTSRWRSLQDWWMNLILTQSFSIREKMTLFWHNNLATELDTINDARMSYHHNLLLRQFAVGNFKTLIKEVTTDPAMLRYLNGNTNTSANPNENYGRELQELFTIGKGVEIAAGNYTNYTEDDVKVAARVLTGWRDVRDGDTSEFRPTTHDTTDKTFSSAYGGTVIKGRSGTDAGTLEIADFVDMIFAQAETAKALCRKLYRFFVYYNIDATVEANIIAPLADQLAKGGFEVKPVLATLFKSAHFHDALNMGCFIKTPVDLVAGGFRQMGLTVPGGTDPVTQYALLAAMVGEASRMQLEIGNPPNVAGWPAFYQIPFFYEVWINSDTLPRRIQYTDKLASIKGYAYATTAAIADVLALATATSKPDTIDNLLADLTASFFPITLTDVQLKYLKDVMLSGVPDYEWGVEWDAYVAAPTDPTKIKPVETRLRALFAAMMELAEYQLC